MSLLTDELRAMVGVRSQADIACDAVEAGAVRRFCQAMMDTDPIYMCPEAAERFGGPVAPALYALNAFRLPFGAVDPLERRARDPDFDGTTGTVSHGLPPLPLPGMTLLNGGLDVELFRYLRHGERVAARSRYLDIYEKQGREGSFLVVKIETAYFSPPDDPVLTVTKTLLRKPA